MQSINKNQFETTQTVEPSTKYSGSLMDVGGIIEKIDGFENLTNATKDSIKKTIY